MPATEGEILEELAIIGARFPGQLPLKTAQVWAKDILDHRFERGDIHAAGKALVASIVADERPQQMRGRLYIGDIVNSAIEARRKRNERAAEQAKAIPAPGQTHRDPMFARAGLLAIRWAITRSLNKQPPTEAEIAARRQAVHSVLRDAASLRIEATDTDVETALACEALGRTLRRLCAERAAA